MVHVIGAHPALGGRRLLAWLVLGGLTGAALMLDFRGRIALALGTALLLAGLQWRADRGQLMLGHGRLARQTAALISALGKHSYALFLVHFPVLLLVNALFAALAPGRPAVAVLAGLAAWGLSNLAAVPFHRWVEGAGAPARAPRPG
jgi:peptidoglycan/LPS O-acetylase OafA/YrhL